MEHSEFILIALILLIVFFGIQVPKLIKLLRSSKTEISSVPVKTVLSATETAQISCKKDASHTKKTPRKKTKPHKNTAKKVSAKSKNR